MVSDFDLGGALVGGLVGGFVGLEQSGSLAHAALSISNYSGVKPARINSKKEIMF